MQLSIVNKKVLTSVVFYSCAFVLTLISGLILNPIVKTSASSDMDVHVLVEPTLSMSLSADEINLDIDASNFGNVVESDPLTVNVSTNNRTGYSLTLAGENIQLPPEPRTLADISTMQDITEDICRNTPLFSVSNATYELTDTRDNNVYSIRRLDDGNCWMVENLKLKGSTTITSEDSDVTENFTLPESSTTNMTYDNINIPLMNDGLDNDGDGVTDDTYDSYGAYYNWYAATANSGTFGIPGNAPSSICAKGWKLPTNDNYNILLGDDSNNKVNNLVISDSNIYLLVGYYNANHIDDTIDGYDYYNVSYSGKNMVSFYSTSDQQKINHYVYMSSGNLVHYTNNWDDKIMSARCVVTVSEPNNEPIQYSDLKPTSSQNTTTIRSIPTQISRNAWQSSTDYNNQYGFTHDNTNFLAPDYFIPVYTDTQPITIKNTDSASKTSNTNITFATKIDSNQLADNYSNDFTISAVTNYSVSGATIFNIHKMQQMTPEICSNTTTPSSSATDLDTDGSHIGDPDYVPSVILVDTRGDGQGHEQTYVVRKLADGNCWMTQNLNLFLTAGNELTSNDTDLNSKSTWDPGVTTAVDDLNTEGYQNLPDSSIYPASYYYGDKYCYGTEIGQGQTCASDLTTVPDNISIDDTNRAGILYNYHAASANSLNNIVDSLNENDSLVPDSICPKGWQLPSGVKSDFTNASGRQFSYNNLLYTSNARYTDSSQEMVVVFRKSPFNFIFSGYIINGSADYYIGRYGYYWTGAAFKYRQSDIEVHYLRSHSGYVDLQSSWASFSNDGASTYSMSIRCVAR